MWMVGAILLLLFLAIMASLLAWENLWQPPAPARDPATAWRVMVDQLWYQESMFPGMGYRLSTRLVRATVFDTYKDADAARQRLIAGGHLPGSISLHRAER